ncbi:hydrolase [Shinella sp. CPCC 100929]|uniref:Hydrolase n=1 Tax=Shinella lacus TaxID=2654216 RepID=A0ABT1R1H1_9HYPH|nr:hydrolase [Shinella lacus]MCQ4628976.1 hydrolase [Shinella lacus]
MSDSFVIDRAKTAVVVIDLQMGVVNRKTVPHAAAIVVANTARLLAKAREVGIKPILVYVDSSSDGNDFVKPDCDRPTSRDGLPADYSVLAPELDRQPEDLVVMKRNWGAFYGTDLELQLRRRGYTTIILCGIATEFGVESTARDAFERGFNQIFVSDAMTAFSQISHDNAIERIFPRLGRVRTTDEVIAIL